MLKDAAFFNRNVEVIFIDLENNLKNDKLIHFWINLLKLIIYIVFLKSVK